MKAEILAWIREWGERRDTSPEIAQAIYELHQGDPQRIWEVPSERETEAVLSLAWELADDSTQVLHWGEHVYERGTIH